jgi:hypothetical protein
VVTEAPILAVVVAVLHSNFRQQQETAAQAAQA